MFTTSCQILFWSSLTGLFYTFLGYPLLMLCLGKKKPTADDARQIPTFTVTVVIAAHNEENQIIPRIENLLTIQYPADQLKILVVSDGSTDLTIQKIQNLGNTRVQVISQPQRQGKANALNLAVAAASTDLIVFADARQSFAPDAIAALASHFLDPKTGAVSGELIIDSASTATGGGVDAYWRLEKFIRLSESRHDSAIGCTGAIYAIRRELYRPIPGDTILDDVVIPMQIALQGYRIAFEPAARAFDPQALEPSLEKIRKRRTLAGNYQMLFRHSGWLLPWRNRLWWQLVSHKYLRLAAPFFLVALFVSNSLLLTPFGFYAVLWYCHCIFYALAICGFVLHEKRVWLFSLPAGFVFLNWMSLAGLWHYLRNKNQTGWELNRAQTAPAKNV